MNQSLILQGMNAELAMLALCSLLIFAHYIYKNLTFGYEFLRAAIALTVLCAGEVLLRAPLWYARQSANMGYPTNVPDDSVIGGSIILIIAFLCVIRVFSPMRWGNNSWIAALFFSTFATLLSIWYTIMGVK